MYTIYDIENKYNEAQTYNDILAAVAMVWDNNIGYTVAEFKNDIYAIFPEKDEHVTFAVEDILVLALLHHGYAKNSNNIIDEDEKIIIEKFENINY